MASVYPRLTKDGEERWRVVFKRKGLPSFSKTFYSSEEAFDWSEENEEAYILNPDSFHKFKPETRKKMKKLRQRN